MYKFLRNGCSAVPDTTSHFRSGYLRTQDGTHATAVSHVDRRWHTQQDQDIEIPPYPAIRKVMEFSVVKSEPNLDQNNVRGHDHRRRPDPESDEETKIDEAEPTWIDHPTDETKMV